VSPTDRALAHGLVGDIRDRQARPVEAFAAFTASNQVLREMHAARYAGPGVETVPAMLDWLIDYFERAAKPAWTPPPAPLASRGPTQHVFLVGFPRSGTTLLENVLAARPEVATIEEKETLTEAVRDFLISPTGLDRLSAAGPADLGRYRLAYWNRVRDLGLEVNGKVVVDKLPLNTMKLPLIATLFPQAKVLFALRDPRDVVLSCYRQRFRMNASMFELLTLDGAAHLYDRVMHLAQIYRAKLTLNLHVHRYEDLVQDFDVCMRAICEFTGVRWGEDMRDFTARAGSRAIATPSSTQVARGLYAEGVGQWRAYREPLSPVLDLLRPWIDEFGYPAD
jgi:hypothetical protein